MYLGKYAEHAVISLMDESLYIQEYIYFGYTRNCQQETIYYIQETKTILEKFFTLILRRNL